MRKRCAVVTPYFKEAQSVIERCHRSVAGQTIEVDHILVSDGFPQDWIDKTPARHIRLDRNHADYGNTPRTIGAMLAIGEEYDAVALLDADNWLENNHCARCLDLAFADGKITHDVVIAQRRFVRADGSVLPIPEEPDRHHVDTNCFFLTKGAFYTLPRWGLMPKALAAFCDRIFWLYLKQQPLRMTRADSVTVNYYCGYESAYRFVGEEPPADARPDPDFRPVQKWLDTLSEEDCGAVSRSLGFPLEQILARQSGG